MRRVASRPGDDAGIALAASALGICLLLMAGLIGVLLVNGLGFFWPKPLLRVTLRDGKTLMGEVVGREPGRLQLKVGNRDLLGLDFAWLDEADVVSRDQPVDAWYLERREYGALIGRLVSATPEGTTLRTTGGPTVTVTASQLVRAYPANQLGLAGRARVYLSRLWEFVAGEPREANTEGGVFPALFGTVLMVLLMSMLAVPGGVLAALYLREYARQGLVVRTVRIAVNNLAGVPSIVFGVFGLGFFVYGLGGGIDRLFFADRLPAPTFGTGGLLWASLTLALLTVPVVVVAAEEALAAVPRSLREASIAAGATQFQTLWRVVLPAASPGILTGLILAMARGAGEVAPLMLTGVVKLAPELPLNGSFPFLHLDRKFMHLGFHIYDVGFQSPNVEAAKPMVFATTLLLLLVVVLLNLVAIRVRNRLRLRDRGSAF
jgi:phosphate transport system permease protein